MFVMIRDGFFNSTSPHVGIHLHSLSGVNGVFSRLALKVFEDSRPDVMCIQPPALLLLIDLWPFCLLSGCFCFSICHIFSNLNGFLDEKALVLFFSSKYFSGFCYTSVHPSNSTNSLPLLLLFLSNETDSYV